LAISIEDVDHVAGLARIELSAEEREMMKKQLSDVLEHARVISEVDTSEVFPTSHAVMLVNVLREDEVKSSISPAEAVANAGWTAGNAFRVPRIV
jgi:aspartyl-tRNA(Asn)/glutamyl-tRNA(Gln) amidotransferase subunit C